MKKIFIISILFILTISPIFAATNDFTADANITVSGVVGDVTADMLIMDTSTAESWTFDSGTFTVTNPGTFQVGSSDSDVKSIKFTQGGTILVCTENSTPGTSYATAPAASGTYTVEPSATTDCTSICTAVANAASYNSFPTCGASNCEDGYSLSGSGAAATCTQNSSGLPVAILNQVNQQPAPETTPTETTDNPTTDSENTNKSESTTKADDITPPEKFSLEQITTDAETITAANINEIITVIGAKRDLVLESKINKNIVEKIITNNGITAQQRNIINNFVTYGTPATKILGAGERAGVVNSFKSAFGKFPSSVDEWNDAIKIANGHWPNQKSEEAENKASTNYKKIYLKTPDRSNPNDDAAITVMAYGLRPAIRNLNSEAAAIKIFKDIYGYSPENATAWDVVRAIAYSGATR